MNIRRYDFGQALPLYGSGSMKYDYFKPDTLPMWVADMDFAVADEILNALKERLELPSFAYNIQPPDLAEIICERMQRMYQWDVSPEQIVFDPGVINGFNTALRMTARRGGMFLLPTPAYPPMLHASGGINQLAKTVPMAMTCQGTTIYYTFDMDALEAAVDPSVHSFMHCNPHNPTGRVFSREELSELAAFCERHDLLTISDEIHCDIVYGEGQHVPIASLSSEISARTVTLMSASKSYNLPALRCSYAIIQNESLRQRYIDAKQNLVSAPNVMGLLALRAAYRDADSWLWQVLDYLEGNRDYLVRFIAEYLPELNMSIPEGTYLAWMDASQMMDDAAPLSAADFPDDVAEDVLQWMPDAINAYFLKQTGVALNNGAAFEAPGFVRMNFAVPRSQLTVALQRMANARSAARTGG